MNGRSIAVCCADDGWRRRGGLVRRTGTQQGDADRTGNQSDGRGGKNFRFHGSRRSGGEEATGRMPVPQLSATDEGAIGVVDVDVVAEAACQGGIVEEFQNKDSFFEIGGGKGFNRTAVNEGHAAYRQGVPRPRASQERIRRSPGSHQGRASPDGACRRPDVRSLHS